MARLLLALMVAVTALVVMIEPAGEAGAASTSALRAVTPCRLIDTRDPAIPDPGARSTTRVQVAGACDVPADAVAASLTVTVSSEDDEGWVTVYPEGRGRPVASLLNYEADQTIANSGLFELGAGGGVEVYAWERVDLIVDVAAYFVAATEAVDGRFVPMPNQRVKDTRETARPAPGTAVVVQPAVPADAVAVAVTLTTTETLGWGWFAAYPRGELLPLASTLNVDAPGQTRAASAIVPLADGAFEVYTSRGDHVIVDIGGYFTGPSAALATDGLFVPLSPVRVFDTRSPDGPSGGPRVHSRGAREIDPSAVIGTAAGAVAANVTVTSTLAKGWWRLGPAGVEDGGVSTLNSDRDRQTIANSTISTLSTRGLVLYGFVSSDVVIDLTGWFAGSPVQAALPVPANNPPYRRVTIIGDSAIAGIRWNGAYGGFRGFEAVPILESCRRLVYPSCNGREGYNPYTARSHITTLPRPTVEEVLVIATGYNDWDSRFSGDFDAVIDAARDKGFENIAWLTYRENNTYRLPGDVWVRYASYAEMNRIIREKVASGAFPEVEIWDLDEYTRGASHWFFPDGVHERRLGSWGVADWLSRHVAAFDDKPCPMRWRPGWSIADPCPNPDPLSVPLGLPYISDLYGL
ncbi:MAG: hypothetical protein ACR2O6_09480 [Ilumatobacteraceae bacterium]